MFYYLVRHTNTKFWFSNILAQYGLKHNPHFTKHQLKASGMLLTFPTAPCYWSRYSHKAIAEGR